MGGFDQANRAEQARRADIERLRAARERQTEDRRADQLGRLLGRCGSLPPGETPAAPRAAEWA